ncbi:low quality protein: lanosterol, partial [Lynx pardinus]
TIKTLTSYNEHDENGPNPPATAGCITPPGHQVCAPPTANQRLTHLWVEHLDFNPDCYLWGSPASGKKFAYVPLEQSIIAT